MESYKVYVKTDARGCVLAIASSAFLRDPSGWTQIDAGEDDRHLHAQAHYLPHPLHDARGVCRYRLEGGQIAERTPAERAADESPFPLPGDGAARLDALETAMHTMNALMNALRGGIERDG